MPKKSEKGKITVQEAGRRGGEATKRKHGKEHYKKIGKQGGAEVRRLIEEGKKH